MRVGKMGEGEHRVCPARKGSVVVDRNSYYAKRDYDSYELPINMPATKTNAPPTTT